MPMAMVTITAPQASAINGEGRWGVAASVKGADPARTSPDIPRKPRAVEPNRVPQDTRPEPFVGTGFARVALPVRAPLRSVP